jgi:SAM-dependent methyltransferase
MEQILSALRFVERIGRPEQTGPQESSPASLVSPAFDYDHQQHHYDQVRRADPRIEQIILRALAGCATVLNVGAGTGSYEPRDRYTIAVEPSAVMRAKRLALGRPPAVDAGADRLPFDDDAFDAGMAVLTIHHWPDLAAGLLEMKRVARRRILLLTYDPAQLDVFWNAHYFPELIEIERRRYPALERIADIWASRPALPPSASRWIAPTVSRKPSTPPRGLPAPGSAQRPIGLGLFGQRPGTRLRAAPGRRPGLRRVGPPVRGASQPAGVRRRLPPAAIRSRLNARFVLVAHVNIAAAFHPARTIIMTANPVHF